MSTPDVSPEQLGLFFRFAAEKLGRSTRLGIKHQEANFHALDRHQGGGDFIDTLGVYSEL